MSSTGLAGSESETPMPTAPYFRRIMDDIRAKIASREWPAGEQIPSTSQLTAHYAAVFRKPDLSAGTIRQAVTLLIEAGELRGQQGVGVFVPDEETS